MEVSFGQEYGTCIASIGGSRALAQVSCSLDRPSETRPNEGRIIFKIELPPLASPSFDSNRQSDFAIELNRLLERAIVKR
jgi:exosome complex component RRP45